MAARPAASNCQSRVRRLSCWHDVPDVEGQPTLAEIFDNTAKELGRELTDDEKHTIMHGVLAGRGEPPIINLGGATFEEAMSTQHLQMQLRSEIRAKAKLDAVKKRRAPTVLLDNVSIKTPKVKKEQKVEELIYETMNPSQYARLLENLAKQERYREQRIQQQRMAEQMMRSMDPVGWKNKK